MELDHKCMGSGVTGNHGQSSPEGVRVPWISGHFLFFPFLPYIWMYGGGEVPEIQQCSTREDWTVLDFRALSVTLAIRECLTLADFRSSSARKSRALSVTLVANIPGFFS